jgi:excisionase family DNA binding protein
VGWPLRAEGTRNPGRPAYRHATRSFAKQREGLKSDVRRSDAIRNHTDRRPDFWARSDVDLRRTGPRGSQRHPHRTPHPNRCRTSDSLAQVPTSVDARIPSRSAKIAERRGPTQSLSGERVMSAPKLLTICQVAERLAVDPKTVRRLIAGKELVASRVGRQWRIMLDDLNFYLLKRRNQPQL